MKAHEQMRGDASLCTTANKHDMNSGKTLRAFVFHKPRKHTQQNIRSSGSIGVAQRHARSSTPTRLQGSLVVRHAFSPGILATATEGERGSRDRAKTRAAPRLTGGEPNHRKPWACAAFCAAPRCVMMRRLDPVEVPSREVALMLCLFTALFPSRRHP